MGGERPINILGLRNRHRLSDSRQLCEEQTAPSNEREARTSERRRFQFTLKQLLFAVAVVAVLLTIWVSLFRKVVNVRAATASDPVRERYFGFYAEDAEIRNVVVLNGGFTKNTWLSASLSAVQSGKITEINGFTIGRSPNQIGGPIRETLTIYLAFGSWNSPNGRVTQLGSVGQSRGSGWGSELPISIPNKFNDSFVGPMTPGRTYLIYAEGDTDIQFDANLTIDGFAKKHSGNYFVVTAQLH